jgi:hypothetical protein
MSFRYGPTATRMTHDHFWNIIADSRRDFDPNRRDGNMRLQAKRLQQLLAAMPAQAVREFDRLFTKLYFDAYRWDLWRAAYIIEGGCSDDGFMDFRSWLISMGREVYQAAMDDPETLAEVVSAPGIEGCFFEEFGGIAWRVLEEKGGVESAEPSGYSHPREPAGERWEDDDFPTRFPRLWAKFGDPNA